MKFKNLVKKKYFSKLCFFLAIFILAIIIINPLENIYSIKDSHLNNESIGRHVRHIIDFYLCFINGIGANHMNYDLRDRNPKIEYPCLLPKK